MSTLTDKRKELLISNQTEKVGEEKYNYQGYLMKIIKYKGSDDIDVQFEDGGIYKHCTYAWFNEGIIKNKNAPNVYNLGYMGYGDYKSSIKGKPTEEYKAWRSMLTRSYDTKMIEKRKSYKGSSVCEEWHNFQNFAKWYEENKWTNELKLQVDKDILHKGNKLYSPETCVLVDGRINSTFRKFNNKEIQNKDVPTGVIKSKKYTNQYYYARIKKYNKKIEYLGSFNTLEEAFLVYKKEKEKYIKETSDEYKLKYPNFPQKLYDAMYKWEIEITD